MKALSKIAILVGFIAFISSCQKEDIMPSGSCSSQNNPSDQRVANAPATQETQENAVQPDVKPGKEQEVIEGETVGGGEDEVIGGGDDDRDGGGKKIKKDK